VLQKGDYDRARLLAALNQVAAGASPASRDSAKS